MDSASQLLLANLIRTQPTGALGTLRQGAPFVSMVLYAPAADFSVFYLHISKLAHHTRDLEGDDRMSLMIAQPPTANEDPQQLARLSIQGVAHPLPTDHPDYANAATSYLARFPQARINFSLADFSLYGFRPQKARFVAGFGRIFNLSSAALTAAAGTSVRPG